MFASVLKRPAAHGAQTRSLVTVGSVLTYEPAAQVVQAVHALALVVLLKLAAQGSQYRSELGVPS